MQEQDAVYQVLLGVWKMRRAKEVTATLPIAAYIQDASLSKKKNSV
jgi:hypothetical protein